jgi:predicted transcriptional regulator
LKNKKDVLDDQTRFNIYNYVLFSPGINFNELCNVLKMRKNGLNHHLIQLEKNGYIKILHDNGFTRIYATIINDEKCKEISKLLIKHYVHGNLDENQFYYYLKNGGIPNKNETEIINVLRCKVPHQIFRFLYFNPDSSQIEISKNLNKHTTTISFHLAKMKKCGIVIEIHEGNKKKFRLNNNDKLLDIFTRIFGFSPYVDKGRSTGKMKYNNIDSTIDNLLEIFPIPFCA